MRATVRSDTTTRSRRLSILATLAALAAVVMAAGGSMAAGLSITTEVSAGGFMLLALALAAGHLIGVEVALALVTGAAVVPTDGVVLPVLVASVVVAHELARLSLDARVPCRLGTGTLEPFAARTAIIAGTAALLAAVPWPTPGSDTVASFLIPLGLVVASVPLFATRWMTTEQAQSDLRNQTTRLAVGLAIGATVVAVASLAATGRAELGSGEPTPTSAPVAPGPSPSPSPTEEPPNLFPSISVADEIRIVLILISVAIVASLLYAALRRATPSFELDPYEFDSGGSTFAMTVPERADADHRTAPVSDGAVVRLLNRLAIDLRAEPDPGRAIRLGYATIEQWLDDQGLARDAHETERELLARTIPELGAEAGAMRALTDAFEQARFSDRAIDDGLRAGALDAVELLRRRRDRTEGDS